MCQKVVSTRGRGKSRAGRGGSRGIKKGTFEQKLRGNKGACHMDVTVKFIVGGHWPHCIPVGSASASSLETFVLATLFPSSPLTYLDLCPGLQCLLLVFTS